MQKHGHKSGGRYTPEYIAWSNIIARCCNSNAQAFKNYGGRGITICSEWRQSFELFLSYVGYRPGKEYEIDRIDNDGHYEPGNVRWATRKTNCRNRRNTKWVEFKGERMSMIDAAERAGVPYVKVKARIRRAGSFEEAIRRITNAT